MKKKVRKPVKNYFKYFLALIVFLLLLLTVSGWLFVRNYKPILSDRLKKQIYIASDSLYTVNFSAVHLNPLLGNFTIDSFRLIADTNTYHRMKNEHRAPPNIFDVFIKEFQLRHIHLWSLIRNKKVKINVIKAENPRIVIHHKTAQQKEDKQTIRTVLYNLTSGPLKAIKIDHIGLHNIYFTYKNELAQNQNKGEDIRLKNMDLVFKDIQIDSSTVKDTSRFLFAKKAWFHLATSRSFIADSLYKVTTNGISYSIVDEKILVNDLKIIPQLSEQAFDHQLTYRKDLFTASIDSLFIGGIKLKNLRESRWRMHRMDISGFNLDVYLNRSNPIEPVEKPLLQEALRNISQDLLIKEVHVKNGNIKYRELNPNSGKIGYVTFENMAGTLKNITNDSAYIAQHPYCKADLTSYFMGKGKLHALFTFNLSDPQNTFTYKGHLGYLKATDLNPATRPLGLLKIKSGRIHSLDYNFKANNALAEGGVDMKYDRLRVSVLSKTEQSQILKKETLISLAANLLLLNENNITDKNTIQHAPVSYKRDKDRSVFTLMWKSIFEGVKHLAGIDPEIEKKLRSFKGKNKWSEESSEKDKDSDKGFFEKVKDFFEKATS